MVLLINPSKAQRKIADNVRDKRLSMELTQDGLSERSGVPLSTLRKFEQTGIISLESFLKLLWVVGGLEELVQSLKPSKPTFKSIDEVVKQKTDSGRKK